MTENQNPEQKARDIIDALLTQAGWVVQSAKKIDLNAGPGQAVREYQTDVGPADYVLFVDKKAVGVIEAKKEELGHKLTEVELQTEGYAAAKLKWVNNKAPLPFLYESTGIITRFTDARDPKPRFKRDLPERYLSFAEYRRLAATLSDAEADLAMPVAMIRLLIYTGARRAEIAGLRWEYIKPPRIFLPDSKTGAKTIYLNRQATAIIDGLPNRTLSGLLFTV